MWATEQQHSSSVHNLSILIVLLQICKDVIGVFAAEVAEAGINPHHLPSEHGSIRALELHLHCFGFIRDAAALICADTTVLWLVELLASAAWDGEIGRLIFPVDV